jgi:hypothetical protein
MSRHTAIGLVGLLALVLVGCGLGRTSIPPGAQVVHVAVTESAIHLDLATVHAGDVYLVVAEGPVQEFLFVSGPFDDAGLARLVQGDWQGTTSESHGGPIGNFFKMVLLAGKYALLTMGAGGPGLPITPGSMAVLEVVP